mmetsp:Transcript_12032/g.28533  ORF Transcript_12032/g.28533 Transcript_12032/m.28533 type:complete len:274 (-) Transcript_12032:219-1040(-)|eukprot:CAMPEP_0197184902 /NCGR_PEP_ID=MMETSP1423-20130617/10816_1 /TAXON_ID=476441 /ORGANISM="Pseudo-nitzschia heimii, Strain UNC1101" /LENGTH=273 /DNA_ID=CAMNT_0042635845 /DNA_START=18 /DNA_END=839 /DNA_ORIENTATION=+
MTAIIGDSSDEAEFEGDDDSVENEDVEDEDSPDEDGEDEDVEVGRRGSRSSRARVSYNEEEDDDSYDEEDDIPLAALKSASPAKKKSAASKVKTKAKAPAKKKAKTTASAKKATVSNPSNNDYSSPSFALYGTESIKGKIIQNLLCRWWYAIRWPDPSTIPKEPPIDCDAMDGFPGFFICTQGEEVGTIKDFRDKEKSPTFNNLAKKSSEELKELLVKAISEQKRQLIESDGPGTSTEKELNSMLKWVSKINTKKADKEAEKVLKANKFSIPE